MWPQLVRRGSKSCSHIFLYEQPIFNLGGFEELDQGEIVQKWCNEQPPYARLKFEGPYKPLSFLTLWICEQ